MNRLPIKRTRKLQLEIKEIENKDYKTNLAEWREVWQSATTATEKLKILARMLGIET